MMSPIRLTALLCVVQLLVMTGSLTFQALIPVFIGEWQLSNAQAAWIGGASYVGYALAAPTLVALTDHLDARRIVICACLLGAVGGLGFAFAADGFWSAMAWRFVTGIAIAGNPLTMPGCPWHGAVFETLFSNLLDRAVAVAHRHAGEGAGQDLFEIRWRR